VRLANQIKPERRVGWLALACLALLVLIALPPIFSNASMPPRGIASPILAMEMVRNVEEVDAILGESPSPDREVMRLKQYIDFGFIAAYTALFLAARPLVGGTAGLVIAIGGAVAGVADVIENIGILRVVNVDLAHTTQGMVDAIRIPSLIKWTLVWIAMALLARFFLMRKGWVAKATGVFDAAAAALGFYGLFDNAFLGLANLPMLLGIIGVVILYWRVR
jgi:hypothetical protein